MTFKTYEINIDLVNESSTNSTIHFSTNDRNAAKLLLTITNKGVELDLSQAKSVRISFKKPDGTRVFQNDCLPINALKGKYQIVLNTQTLAVEGYVYAQVHIEEEDKIIDTQKFFFVVNESLASDEAFESTNAFGFMQKYVEASEKLEGVDIDALVDSKETAESALAKSTENTNQIGILSKDVTMNGTDVTNLQRSMRTAGKDQCMVIFTDDDGRTDFLTKFKPLYDSKGIKCSLAINSSFVGTNGYMSLEQLKDLQSQGYEIISHGEKHLKLADQTDAVAEAEVKNGYLFLKDNGFKGADFFAYPNGCDYTDYRSQNIVRKYHKVGIATQNGIDNVVPFNSFCLTRYDLATRTLSSLQGIVDYCLAKNLLLVFMGHSWMAEFTEQKMSEMASLIDYIKGKGIPIVTHEEALNKKGNVIEVNEDAGTTLFRLSKTGKVNSVGLAGMKFKGTGSDVNAAISTYEQDVTTITTYANGAVNTPSSGIGGTCFTYRPKDSSDTYSYQIWFDYSGIKMWKRRWKSNAWEAWAQLNPASQGVDVDSSAQTNLDALITSYTVKTMTMQRVSSGNASTAPTPNVNGILTTFRFSDDFFSYQEWKAVNATSVWRRNWNTVTSTWGAWGQ